MKTIEEIKNDCRAVVDLADKATPGPWSNESDWPRVVVIEGHQVHQVCQMVTKLTEKTKGDQTPDTHFIAHSRAFTPLAAKALLIAIEGLEEVASFRTNSFYQMLAIDADKELELIRQTFS